MNIKELVLNQCKRLGYGFDINNPITIQDKLNWLKIYDCTELKTKCADKVALHDYCKEKLGDDICVPLLAVYEKPEDIEWEKLPQSCIIKCNHGSGMNIIVRDKNAVNKETIKTKLRGFLNKDHATAIAYEMHYHNIPRKIMVEPLLSDETQKDSLFDYKFWCFNGKPKLFTINDGHGHGDIIYYNIDGTPSDVKRKGVSSKTYEIPNKLKEMVKLAQKLCAPFKFVRVDFYYVNNKIYLGELTFIPGAGLYKYATRKNDIEVGNMLKLSDNKKVIYTCLTGGYDILPEQTPYQGWDYICFTDSPETIKSKVWQPFVMPKETDGLSNSKKNRWVKINAHKVLSDYDVSVYIDSNMIVKQNPDKLIESCGDSYISIGQHPGRDCIYDEELACEKLRKDSPEIMRKQIERYKSEGFPKHFGLTQNNIIIRKHNDKQCIKLMEMWWNEVSKGSHRDQLSLFYCLWKDQTLKVHQLSRMLSNSEWFWRAWGHKSTGTVFRNTTQRSAVQTINPQAIQQSRSSHHITINKIHL